MKKKTFIIIVIIVLLIAAAAIIFILKPGSNAKTNGSLNEIMTKLYGGIKEDELPMMLADIELTKDNIANFVGTSDIDFKEAMANEPGIGSIAHSVVLIRLNDASKASETVKKIQDNANPAKWICVASEKVIVKSKGDLVILIMSDNELAQKINKNFEGLR